VTKQTSNSSFAQLKQIHAGALNVGYADEGPAAIHLHGSGLAKVKFYQSLQINRLKVFLCTLHIKRHIICVF